VYDHRNPVISIDPASWEIWRHNTNFFAVDTLEICIVSPEFGLCDALLREPIDLLGEVLDLSNAGRWAD
jgi:hypothetical protein